MEASNSIQFVRFPSKLTDHLYPTISTISKGQPLKAKTPDELLRQVLTAKAQVGYCAMIDMPLQLPDGLVIAAISKRYTPGYTLLINKEAIDPTKVLKLKEGATVGCFTVLQEAQFKDLRADVQISCCDSWQESHELFQKGQLDAILLHNHELTQEEMATECYVSLNPKEVIPLPGDGFVCYICKSDDKPLRRRLQQLHHSESVEANNLERGVKQLIPDSLLDLVGVYCMQDANDFYHGNAVLLNNGKLRYTQFSSGTTVGFVKELWARLNKV